MMKNNFRNPLIQSGAVLLFIFLLISIVVNSQTDGFFSSFAALFSGLISGILFIIALFIAIIFSVAVIIGIFFGAVSIHSVDNARTLFSQMMDILKSFYCQITTCSSALPLLNPTPTESTETSHTQATGSFPESADRMTKIEEGVKKIEQLLAELQSSSGTVEEQISNLQKDISQLQNGELPEKFNSIEKTQVETSSELAGLSSTMDQLLTKTTALETRINEEFESVRTDIDLLNEKTSVPDVVSGILSYIDLPEDRETIAQKAEEAVARGMTYSQIDDFFKASLPEKVFEKLSSHPRLTKDFIRSVKKKFE